MESYCLLYLQDACDELKSSFITLPDDQYIKSVKKFRKRRYSTGLIKNNQLRWRDNQKDPFMQSSSINGYVGDIKRDYEPLTEIAKHFMQEIFFPSILNHLPSSDYEIGIHQIRVVADNLNMGLPAPEGVHQDGFDYVSILSINSENVAGGTSILLSSKNHQDVVFEQVLQPSNCLLLNDKNLYHYVSPIVPKLPGNCYRDVIITTFEFF